ncbi:MAG: sigma 54-interacting transcriptional regulator [Spirochaetales bacterium]|nr:sigma 54-interacting transcriptional regulator [Spirochaetales bacterium]
MSGRSGSGIKKTELIPTFLIIAGSFLFVFILSFLFADAIGLWNARLNDNLFRLRYRLFGKGPVSPYLTHVTVNDTSYDELGSKLWDHRFYADMIGILGRSGASSIACDFVFERRGDGPGDSELVEETLEAGNIYYPVIFRGGSEPGVRKEERERGFPGTTGERNIWHPAVLHEGVPFTGETVETVFPALATACRGMGHINASPDEDGINRRFPLIYRFEDGYVPSLVFHALCDLLHVKGDDIEVSFGSHILLKNAHIGAGVPRDINIPVDDRGRAIIDYPGRWGDSFLQFPVHNIVEAAADVNRRNQIRDVTEGTLVLFSDISLRVNDYGTGILDPLYPLSGIHLTVANMILTENFIRDCDPIGITLIYAIGIFLLCVCAAFWKSQVFYPAAAFVFLLFILYSVSGFFFMRTLPLMLPFSLGFFLAIPAVSMYRFVRERQEKRLALSRVEIKKAFYENVSHELKTPLALISGPLDVLLQQHRKGGPELIEEQLLIAKRNAKRLADLVDQILDLSRIGGRAMGLSAAKTDISPIIDSITRTFAARAAERNIRLLFSHAEEKHVLYIDRLKFERIIGAILFSQIRSLPRNGKIRISLSKKGRKKPGGRYIEIRLRMQPDKKFSRGITAITDNFFRSVRGSEEKKTDEVMEEAAEIGLLLAREMILLHHGIMRTGGNPVQGSEVVLSFLCGKDHLDPSEIKKPGQLYGGGRDEAGTIKITIAAKTHQATPVLKNCVLAVAGDRDMLTLIKTVLSPSCTVIEAVDACDGLDKAETHKPDCVVCTSYLPATDGDEFIKLIRESETVPSIPIVLLSDRPARRLPPDGSAAVPDEVIAVPFHPAELMAKVNYILSVYKAVRKTVTPTGGETPAGVKGPLHPSSPIVIAGNPDVSEVYQRVLIHDGITNIVVFEHEKKITAFLEVNQAAVLILDHSLSSGGILDFLTIVHEDHPEIPVIIVTGKSDPEDAVRCMKLGAFDYLVKPLSDGMFRGVVRRAIEQQKIDDTISSSVPRTRPRDVSYAEAFACIVTQNRHMYTLFETLASFSLSHEPILIEGESGVGKKLFARAVHTIYRDNEYFVPVNIAGIDDTLFSDTLFGHVKGAFTTAIESREGLIARAERGSIFLDEIGDLELASQVKLLELIEDHEYYPLGSDKKRASHARIILATNRDLKRKIKEGGFREDLYQRITHKITIPPLRERFDDLPLLLDHFFTAASASMGKKKPVWPAQLITLLKTYHFPGNVRELEAMIKNAVSLHKRKVLSLGYFRQYIEQQKHTEMNYSGKEGGPAGKKRLFDSGHFLSLREAEASHIHKALEAAGGNMTIAAQLLGLSLSALSRRLKKLK